MADKLKLVDQYAIMLLESDPNAYSEEWNADYERGFLDAINKALELPTIEAEPVNGWVSVDDRLPEINEHYRSELVMCYSPDGEHEYLFDYYEVNGFGQGCFTAEKYFGITITHWRTLPEPPKGE